MSARRLPRRVVVGATSAALVAGAVGFIPLLGSASAASCAAWTDPKGDSVWHDPIAGQADPTGASADSQMDIVSSTLSVVGDSLVGTITTDGLTDGFTDMGDEFGFDFTVNGKAINLFSDRDPTGTTAGLLPAAPATSAYDVAKKTVTLKAKLSDLDKAVGSATAGKSLSGISSYSSNQLAAQFVLINYDRSETTATVLVSPGCGGDAGPAPTGNPTPSGSPSPTPSPTPTTAPGGLFDQPRKNCVQYKDATGDADPVGDPVGIDQEDSLDVTQVNLKSPAGQLQVYVGLVDPAATLQSPPFSGRTYAVALTVAGKAVALTAPGDGAATATVGGTANTDIKATAKVDTPHKNIVFTVPLDGLSKAVASAVTAGTAITGTAITTKAGTPLGAQTADTAAGTTTAEKAYAYGDNGCFKPPPGVVEIDADASGQYSDVTELFATLKDADGSPVQHVKVTGVLTGGRPVTATTDDDGIADLKLPLLVAAGTKTLTVTYAGDSEVGPAKATKTFKVVAEQTLLKAVGIRGGASATVVDNDKHPVVGRYVTFIIGSTKRTVKTNSRGVAVLTGVKKGTAIKVVFLAVKGYYLASPTYTVRAL
jgi:hypothetical protein